MRYDEAFTFDTYAIAPVGHIVATYNFPNNHILHTLLVHFAWRAFGDHVSVVRLPALLAGLALIPATFAVTAALYDRRAALLAAALAAGFAPLVDYSVDGRGYALGILLALAALWLAAELLRRRTLWAWAAFVACCALAVYTVPIMAYAVTTVALWMAACALLARPPRVRLVIELAVALAVAAGIAVLLYSATLGQPGWSYPPPLPARWGPITDLIARVWGNWNRAAPHPLDWLVAVGFGVSLATHRRIARHPLPLALPAVVTLAGVVAFGRITPFARGWLYLLPLYLASAAAGLTWLARRAARSVRMRPSEAGFAIVAIASGVAFVAATWHAGLHGEDQVPASDNDVVGLVRRFVPPGQRALLEQHLVAISAAYYFRRSGAADLVTTALGPAERRARHVVAIVPNGTSPAAVVAAGGGRAAGPPRPLARREYVSLYDVPLAD